MSDNVKSHDKRGLGGIALATILLVFIGLGLGGYKLASTAQEKRMEREEARKKEEPRLRFARENEEAEKNAKIAAEKATLVKDASRETLRAAVRNGRRARSTDVAR
ncbi:hypothetical protein [Rhizobium etli]|nr:hypothetical protein [Rhizobium etli]